MAIGIERADDCPHTGAGYISRSDTIGMEYFQHPNVRHPPDTAP